MYLRNVQCNYCKNYFETTCNNAKYCSECRKEVRKNYISEYKKKEKLKKELEKKEVTLADVSRLAREQGMTYGKYVAEMEGRVY